MHKDERDPDQIQIGQTPRVYAPGSIVDEQEVVDEQPTSDDNFSDSQLPHPVTRQQAQDELGAEFPDREDIATHETPSAQTVRQEEYAVTHQEQAVPNYRDETYRAPDETLQEGQDAARYDEQKQAVSDGSRFIPKEG